MPDRRRGWSNRKGTTATSALLARGTSSRTSIGVFFVRLSASEIVSLDDVRDFLLGAQWGPGRFTEVGTPAQW